MKFVSRLLMLPVMALGFAPACAGDLYLGVGYHMGTYDEAETDFPDVSLRGVELKVGRYIGNSGLAAEGRLVAEGSDTVNYFDLDIDIDLEYMISLFLKGDLPVSERINFYGLFGFSKGKFEASALGTTISGDDGWIFSYGAGIEANIGKGIYISGEYIAHKSASYLDDYTAFNIGISKRFSSPSIAGADNMYLGAGYHMGTYDETGFPEANPNGIKIKVGKYIAENVAVEGHLLFGTSSDTITYFGDDIKLKLKNGISVFVKGDLPISESSNFYGLLGFTRGKLEASAFGATISDDDSGLSYGVGIETNIGNDIYISGEYIFYISESNYDYTGLNIGISKRF